MNLISNSGKNIMLIVFFNVLIGLFFYLILCCIFSYLNKSIEKQKELTNSTSIYNTNTIRATYPTYDNIDDQTAVAIFKEYSAPKTSYQPYIGYRRDAYKGSVVNIEPGTGGRLSVNHQLDNSIWFFGGSTMWGTGATDETTIPSFVAKMTGEAVLNLGESGYSSFQELVYLQLMLLQGHTPKKVVFYDGTNDGYRYCQKNEPVPSHAYYSRYRTMISEYKKLKSDSKLRKKDINMKVCQVSWFDFFRIKTGRSVSNVDHFLKSPWIYLKNRAAPAKITTNEELETDKSFSEFHKKSSYLVCEDEERAKIAARATVFSWLRAYVLLKEKNIPVLFVLQPTGVYQPNRYNLDYLINGMKQRIADEADNYSVYYPVLREEWKKQCQEYNACGSFLDLSEVFFDDRRPIFIDNCHIGPLGNEIVAQKIVQTLNK